MFLEQVTTRLYSASSEIVQTFLSGLYLSRSVQLFKLALCRKFLSDESESGGRNTSTRRPKPQARAVRVQRGTAPAKENLSSSNVDDSSTLSSASKISFPTPGDVVQLLTVSNGSNSSPTILIVKKELLISYGYLQQIAERRDVEWQQLAAGGRLEDLVNSIFGEESYALQDRDALIGLVRVWATS